VTKRVQDRYRAGERRTSAKPLEASWHPAEEQRRKQPKRPTGLRGALATYGWRIYALPVLVAVTVLVLIDTTGDDGGGAQAQQGDDTAQDGGQTPEEPPDVTESPVVPPDLNVSTAELPNGATYPEQGNGEFTVLPGRGERVGTGGDLYTYTVEVEGGIDLAPLGGLDSFAALVDATLAEPRGWAASGQVSVQRVDGDEEPDIRMTLATPKTLQSPDYCGRSIPFESSCWRSSEKRVMINLARWIRGAVAYAGNIGDYRIYAINHEIGHAFRKGHVGCAANGDLAPVMMQQSFGVSNDLVAGLNDQAGNSDPVDANGLTCRPNPWPNPQAQPPG